MIDCFRKWDCIWDARNLGKVSSFYGNMWLHYGNIFFPGTYVYTLNNSCFFFGFVNFHPPTCKIPRQYFFCGGGGLNLNVLYKIIVCAHISSIFITNKEPQYLRILKSLKWAVNNFISCLACCVSVFGFLSLPI